jgi:iron(III) transport system ATP-binding protein
MTFALSIRGLRHAYGAVEILHSLDLDVPAGSTLAVLGPSGCGKSTLLRLVAGFERPTAGQVDIAGVTVVGQGSWVPPQRRRIGYVAQEGSLFPHLSVRRNLEFGVNRRRRGDRARVAELLDLVSLDASCLDRYPHELSGGQQQRVALARTLARRPTLVLLDEPFAALDADLRAATRAAMAAVLRNAGVATVLVTHDQGEALSFADELAVMVSGRFTQVGSTRDVYECPADLETARLVGSALVVPGTVLDGYAETPLGRIPLRGRSSRGAAEVMLRPEQLSVRPSKDGSAIVERVHYFGHDRLLDLVWPGSGLRVHARVPGHLDCETGERVEVAVNGAARAFLTAAGRDTLSTWRPQLDLPTPNAGAPVQLAKVPTDEVDLQQQEKGHAEQQPARQRRDGTSLVGLDSGY